MIEIPCKITPKGDKEYAKEFVGAAQSQLRILESEMTFLNLKQGARKVQLNPRTRVTALVCFNMREVIIDCLPIIKKKKEKEELEKLSKFYVYVTISDYVTIWDLLTGEVAEDICNNNGKIYNDNGDPLVTFPCHKDELVKWLEGIKDKPTRQVLKDEPEDNRDYKIDNVLDIGNENRVEKANKWDPSYNYYFGVLDPCVFTNTVRDIHVDTDPTYPYSYPRKVYDLLEKDTPHSGYVVSCEPGDCSKSFYVNIEGMYYYPPNGNCMTGRYNTVKYFEPYQPRSKKLYLGSYPNPTYMRPGSPSKRIEYSMPEDSPYLYPITMKSSAASFNCTDAYSTWDWGLSHIIKNGYAASFSTVLGNLIVNHNSARELSSDHDTLYDIFRQDFDLEGDCFSTFLREGTCYYLHKWETRGSLWGSCGSPEHAQEWLHWCSMETLSISDQIESESNRFGVTWCGSPYDYRNSLEAQTDRWYRILLRFYMGGFHTGGHSCLQNWSHDPSYCPNQVGCDVLPPEWGGIPTVCEVTSLSNELKERFSYVQPTIELEKPEGYPKEINIAKYERPENYNANPDGTGFCIDKKYSTLCAFPGRDQGYCEENNKCFPFDGTYVLHTLGEAVEELINGHYVDGSDDQLLVYLYERSDMIEEEI
jgi:hypothetical protein